MHKIIECKLEINSEINGKKDLFSVEGKGFYKKEDEEITVYFTFEDSKYKYIYSHNKLIIYFNDSCYEFEVNKKCLGKIKNGDFIFEVTTFATRLELGNNSIILDYELAQQGSFVGKYSSLLSFK